MLRPILRRAAAVTLASALVIGAAACGADADPPAADAGVAPTTVGDAGPGTTTGTEEPGGAADVETIEGIGDDDAFPDLGNPAIDVADYELDLDYEPESGELQGRATLAVSVLDDVDQIELDFQGLTVDSAEVDGDEVDHDQKGQKLTLDLADPASAGDEVTVVVAYSGVPEPVATDALDGVEVGWHSGEDGSFVLSEPEGASTWYPVNNHPLDKATYTFRVTVPDPYSAIANGALVSSEPSESGDATTFEWRMDAPMASYLASVVTGDFFEVDGGTHDGVAYSYWYATGVDQSKALENSDALVAELVEHLGPFPFETYGGVVYPPSFIDGNSMTEGFLSGVALEVQGRSLFAEGTTVESVILHEAAHQWMGDNVSITDWANDIWWVEGFAHFAEYIDDPDQLADLYPELRSQWQPPGDLPVDQLFFGCSYECGGMVFYALYREVGEDVFWEILREFNTRYRHANASTDDLIDVASEVSGTDLTDFFDAWLFDETPPPLPN
jgi:aminopeptidase N